MCYYILALRNAVYAPVAQLDRVTDYESVGRGFESLPAYQKGIRTLPLFRKGSDFFTFRQDWKDFCGCPWSSPGRRLDGADTIVLRVPSGLPKIIRTLSLGEVRFLFV